MCIKSIPVNLTHCAFKYIETLINVDTCCPDTLFSPEGRPRWDPWASQRQAHRQALWEILDANTNGQISGDKKKMSHHSVATWMSHARHQMSQCWLGWNEKKKKNAKGQDITAIPPPPLKSLNTKRECHGELSFGLTACMVDHVQLLRGIMSLLFYYDKRKQKRINLSSMDKIEKKWKIDIHLKSPPNSVFICTAKRQPLDVSKDHTPLCSYSPDLEDQGAERSRKRKT